MGTVIAPAAEDGEVGHRPLRPVLGEDDQLVARGQAEVGQAERQVLDPPGDFLRRDGGVAAVLLDQEQVVLDVGLDGVEEELAQGLDHVRPPCGSGEPYSSLIPAAGLSTQRKVAPFVAEEPFLPPEAAAVARQPAVAPDDAVAGDDDRDGIAVVGPADRPGRGGLADGLGDGLVGRRPPEPDGEELSPRPCFWKAVPPRSSLTEKDVRPPRKYSSSWVRQSASGAGRGPFPSRPVRLALPASTKLTAETPASLPSISRQPIGDS